jgi:type II restriction enzyme
MSKKCDVRQSPLQKAVITHFLPRFGHGAGVLDFSKTASTFLGSNDAKSNALKFLELAQAELPDVIAYSEKKNWLFLIDTGPGSRRISPIRLLELKRLAKECAAEVVFISAFLTRETFRKFAPEIAWETEVWFADAPDHLVHFDGDKFLGPYKSS